MQCGFKFYSVLDCLVKNGEIYVRSDFSNVYETENHFSKNEFIHLLFSYDWVYNGDESNIPQFFFKACWCSKHPKNVCRNHLQLKSDLRVYLDALFGLWRIHSPFAVWHNKLVVTSGRTLCSGSLTPSGDRHCAWFAHTGSAGDRMSLVIQTILWNADFYTEVNVSFLLWEYAGYWSEVVRKLFSFYFCW